MCEEAIEDAKVNMEMNGNKQVHLYSEYAL